ncbi:hypothetical protein B7486_68815, partial [cyanobacterium TDX16]
SVTVDADGNAWVADSGNHRVQEVGETLGFRDVGWDHPKVDDVIWMATADLDRGDDQQRFRPADPETREELAVHLHRLAGAPEGPFPDPGVDDLPADDPAHTAAAWLVAEGGTADGTTGEPFAPEQPVTRSQLAAVLHLLRGSPEPAADGEPFADEDDVQASEPVAITWAVEAGLVSPYDDGSFRPSGDVTRAAAATVLHRYAELDPVAPVEQVPTLVGSAGNVLGNDPTSEGDQPGFWL